MPTYPSETLRLARRSLEGLAGVEHIGNWVYYERLRTWGLFLRLCHDGDSDMVPTITGWHITASDAYPFGDISIYPDRESGITATFHHQRANRQLAEDLPWRAGNICTGTQFQHFGRFAFTKEPWRASARLRWYVARVVEWVRAAANGTLVVDDDPFERPVFDSAGEVNWSVAFQEDAETYQRWSEAADTSGVVELVQTATTGDTLIVSRFLDGSGRELLLPPWPGRHFNDLTGRYRGVWLRTSSPPVVPPYAAPTTWRELRQVLTADGIDLWRTLEPLVNKVRKEPAFFLLLGYPIKEREGDDWSGLHWQAAAFPPLASGNQALPGFRRGHDRGRWMLDRRTVLQQDQELVWQPTRNWTTVAITSRGRFPDSLANTKVLLIGAGSLGALIAEQLVRGGVMRLTVVDDDELEIGNLVRHTLTLAELGTSKSAALANHLNRISPNTAVTSIDRRFSPLDAPQYRDYDLVLDTTGSDEVAYALEAISWPDRVMIVSVSVGFAARRLYFYATHAGAFLTDRFLSLMEPLEQKDMQDHDESAFPREELGCWNPVFPARVDDMTLMAGCVVKELDHLSGQESELEHLVTFEQRREEALFAGIARVKHRLGP